MQILAKFVKASSKQAKQFDLQSIENPSLKRQFELLLVEGVSALDEDDFDEYNDAQKLVRYLLQCISSINLYSFILTYKRRHLNAFYTCTNEKAY